MVSVRYRRIWSFVARMISAPIRPMKSAPCGPNCLTRSSREVDFSGAGNRSGSVAFLPVWRADRSATRWHNQGSACTSLPGSSYGAPSGNPDGPQARCRLSHSRVQPEPPPAKITCTVTSGASGHRDDPSSSSRLQPPRNWRSVQNASVISAEQKWVNSGERRRKERSWTVPRASFYRPLL